MDHVLFVGPDIRNHRGGVAAVLEVYSKYISPFKFIPTYVTKGPLVKLKVYVLAVLKLFYVLATDRKIRILHIHNASKGSFFRKSFMLLIGKLFGKKVILHNHGGGFRDFYNRSNGLQKWYIRFILKKSDLLICVSQSWYDYYTTILKIRNVALVKNVIDKPMGEIGVFSKNGHVNLLFLGHINTAKGIFDLVEVLGENKQNFNGRVFVTVAGVGDVGRLNSEIANKRVHQEVRFAGWATGEVKAGLLSDCDAYILPSYKEGMPISILEAMSYGKPIIATEVGGIPEIVKPGFNGWLFSPGDKKALGNIISEVLENKHKLKEYGRNSLGVASEYSPESVILTLRNLYEKLTL